MNEISEIPPFSFEVGEINDQMLDDLDKVANTPPHSVADEMIKMFTHEIRRLRAENERFRAALQSAVDFADEAWAKWDADEDVRVGKMLIALAGGLPKYRPETDAIHETLRLNPCQSG